MNAQSLREAIDACRPGSSDLSEPEFAEIAARIATDGQLRGAYEACQKFDVAVRDALHEVASPAGLADRLLAATRSAQDVGSVSLPAARGDSNWTRSFELLAPTLAILACAAALLLAAWYASAPPITPDDLVDRSLEWTDQLDHEAWNENLKSAPRTDFPLSSRVAIAPWRWQRLSASNSERVVYYGGPPRVYLYVVRSQTKVQGLGETPKMLRSTGGWSVGGWQAGELTYVLVVEGDKRKFESHLRTQTPV